MAHFYGTIKGKGAKEATGQGTKSSGLRVVAASYEGSIEVWLQARPDGDYFDVRMKSHQGSRGWEGQIIEGKMGMPAELPGVLPAPTIESFTDEALAAEVKRRFGFELVLRQPLARRKPMKTKASSARHSDDTTLAPLSQLLQRVDIGQEFPDAYSAVITANKLTAKQADQLKAEYDAFTGSPRRKS